jgi:acetylornithine deacetylase/succinyl-diaminopimelate desuccinylase-like protein
MIEGCEESGSFDLPYYVEHLKADIKTPSLVICLDSGCGNYEQMWMTTSLRGLCAGDLKIKIINEAVHSGSASGIVPSTFRIMRMLLNRVEDTETGEVLVKECYAEIPAEHVENAKATADALGDVVFEEFPFVEGAQPMGDKKKTEDMILARTWKPMISYTGIEGLPNLTDAGNVLRTDTNVKLSMRIPPTVDPKVAGAAVKAVLEANPPYGAHVEFELEDGAAGWKAPEMEPWVMASADEASKIYFGKPAVGYGEGGTIPLMGMLSAVFPGCQFVITGLLGPGSNAHGPNEFLHLDMGKKLTCCMANMLADHHTAKVVNANK